MPNFWNEVFVAFGTYDLYDIFGVDKQDIDFDEKLTAAHRRIARRLHPDKSSARNATQKFQVFQAIYKILSDKDARALLENGGKVDGNRSVQLYLQNRDRLDRPIRMVLSIDSHVKLKHHFPQALQF